MTSEPSERLLKEIKKAGKDSRLRFLASPIGDGESDEPVEQAAYLARVETIDRAGIWIEYLEGPDTVKDMQVLWPDPGWRYNNVRLTPAPARTRPIIREEQPASPPKRKEEPRPTRRSAARRSPSPETLSSDDSSTQRRSTKRSRSIDTDLQIRDIATGDRGVWTRLAAGIKIPYEMPDDLAWMYLYAAKPMSGATWRQHALAFRLRMCASFRSFNMSEECDHTLTLLSEIVEASTPRATKQAWLAPLWLLSRFIQLVLRASSMGGAAAATKFDELFRTATTTKDGKLDVNDCLQQALAHERAVSLKKQRSFREEHRDISKDTERRKETKSEHAKDDERERRGRERLTASIRKISDAAKKRE